MTWLGWSLLSALFAALTALLAKKGIAHVEPNLATAIRTTVVVIMAWFIAAAFGRTHEIRQLDGRTWLLLSASGIATGLSWLCYFRALSLGPVSKVAPLDKLSVVLVLVLAWPLLGERLTVVVSCLLLEPSCSRWRSERLQVAAIHPVPATAQRIDQRLCTADGQLLSQV